MTGCRVAVTGAAGFLGGALARRLLATPDLRVGGDAPSAVGSLQLLDLVDHPGSPELLGQFRRLVGRDRLASDPPQLEPQ